MKITISYELMNIFREILKENKTLGEWAEIEADDMFMSENYSGGFDATERAFCFSYYDKSGSEYWFQLTLDELGQIIASGGGEIKMRLADL